MRVSPGRNVVNVILAAGNESLYKSKSLPVFMKVHSSCILAVDLS